MYGSGPVGCTRLAFLASLAFLFWSRLSRPLALTYGEIRLSNTAIEWWLLGRRRTSLPFGLITEIAMYSSWRKGRIDNVKVSAGKNSLRFGSTIEGYDELLRTLVRNAPLGTTTFDADESIRATQGAGSAAGSQPNSGA